MEEIRKDTFTSLFVTSVGQDLFGRNDIRQKGQQMLSRFYLYIYTHITR